MVWRGWCVALTILLLVPLVAADNLITDSGFTVTSAQPARSIVATTQAGQTYKTVTIDFDLTIPANWRDNLPPPEQAQWFYPVIGLRKTEAGCASTNSCLLLGLTVKKGGVSGSPRTILESRYGATDAQKQDWSGWTPGQTYHVTLVVNGETKQVTSTIRRGDGTTQTLTYPIPGLRPQDMSGMRIDMGMDRDGLDGAYWQILGWRFANIRVEGAPGTFAAGTGPLGGPPAGGGNGTTPVTLKQINGVFFTPTVQQGALSVPVSGDTPYQEVTVEFDMEFARWRSDALATNGGVHEYFLVHLFSTEGGVPKPPKLKGFWISGFTIRGKEGGWKSALDPYGGPEPVPTKQTPWVPGRYHVKMVAGGNPARELIVITKDGRPFEQFEYPLAAIPEHSVTPLRDVFSDGLRLGFGIEKDTHEYHMIPLGFTFSNLLVKAVPGELSGGAPSQPLVFRDLAAPFVPSVATPVRRIEFPVPTGSYAKARLQMDVTSDGWYQASPSSRHSIFWFVKDARNFDMLGYVFAQPNQLTLRHGIGVENDGKARIPANLDLARGQKYHFDYTFDPQGGQATLIVTRNGQEVARASGPPNVGSIPFAHDGMLTIDIGFPQHNPGANPPVGNSEEAPTYGWTYANLTLELTPGAGNGSTSSGPLTLKPAAGFEPNEAGDGQGTELARANGQFFEEPFQGRCSDGLTCPTTKTFAIPSNGSAYEKVTVKFDFTTEDLLREGWYQHLAQLQNACSKQRYWRLLVKHPFQGAQGKTILDARGNQDWLAGDAPYAENTRYTAEVTYDFLDEEVYVKIFDSAGTLVHTVGDRLNSNPGNIAKVESTADGFELVFGLAKETKEQIYGQPHWWKFSNLVVTAVPLGSGSGGASMGPGGADLSSDEGRMAFLAAHLIDAADDESFTLDCGPAAEVLPSPPHSAAAHEYCAVSYDGKIAFAAFTPAGSGNATGEAQILASFRDDLFSGQLSAADINAQACDRIDATERAFQECSGAIRGMHVYAMVDASSQTSFIVVSKDAIGAFYPGILSSIIGFFRRIFGITGADDTPGALPLRRFHHGYFAQLDEKQVAAAWLGDDATLSYKEFSTDFNLTRPPGSVFSLGSGTQVVRVRLDPDAAKDVLLWRRMTSALRLADAGGEPIEGDVCGNGIVGNDEECEANVSLGRCSELFPVLSSNATARCFPPGHARECIIDIQSCFGNVSGCHDDWTERAGPNPCHPSQPDPACPRGNDQTCEPACTGGMICVAGACQNPTNDCNPACQDGYVCVNSVCQAVDTTPVCPSTWTDVAHQGVYRFQVAGVGGAAQLRVISTSTHDTCIDDDIDVDLNFGPYGHPVSRTLIYHRHKPGYETKIWLSSNDSHWILDGDPTVSTRPGDPGEGVAICWQCGLNTMDPNACQLCLTNYQVCIQGCTGQFSGQRDECLAQCGRTWPCGVAGCGGGGGGGFDLDCTPLGISIPVCNAGSNSTNATCTGPGGCCMIGQPCSNQNSSMCCGGGISTSCGVSNACVRSGDGPDPPDHRLPA
jgi:hypothetical protein